MSDKHNSERSRAEVEGQATRFNGLNDSEAPDDTDVSDETTDTAEVEGQAIRGSFEPSAEVEGHASTYRFGSDSEAPENTDLSDVEAAEKAEVEGQFIRVKRNDSLAPESTDANDSTDEPEVEGQGFRWS